MDYQQQCQQQTQLFRKNYRSEITELVISNEEMEDIMKTVKSLKKSGLLVKRISETIKNQIKEQKGRFLPVLLGTLAAILLWSALQEKE